MITFEWCPEPSAIDRALEIANEQINEWPFLAFDLLDAVIAKKGWNWAHPTDGKAFTRNILMLSILDDKLG